MFSLISLNRLRFFFFCYSFPFCRSTKKKKVTENNNDTNWIKREFKNSKKEVIVQGAVATAPYKKEAVIRRENQDHD